MKDCAGLKKVWMDKQFLYISNFRKKITVLHGTIDSVTENRRTKPHTVTIYFRATPLRKRPMQYRLANIIILFIFLLTVTGCATTSNVVTMNVDNGTVYHVNCNSDNKYRLMVTKEDINDAIINHIVFINEKGKYEPLHYKTECGSTQDGIEGKQPQKLDDHLNAIFDSIKKQNYTDITLIIHGGLVKRSEGIADAIAINHVMSKDLNNRSYPIFLNWRSHGLFSYKEQLFNIRNSVEEPFLARATSPFKLASDLGRGIADTPFAAGLEAYRLKQLFSGKLDTCTPQNIAPEIICEPSVPNNLSISNVFYFMAAPLRIGTSPILNGLGKTAWENMVRQTRLPFFSSTDPVTRQTIAGDLLEISRRLSYEIDNQATKLTLIGHSMGTMVASEFIRSNPTLPYQNIVFMGAAVSGRDFINTVVPVLEKKEAIHFYNLSLDPTAEAHETTNHLLPSGSLLEWVDEMFTSTPTVYDRTFGKWVNARQLYPSIPEKIRKQMTFRVFGNKEGQPRNHGDFNNYDMCFWRRSFWNNQPTWEDHHKDCQDLLVQHLPTM
jgi:pimeloyl-ACP methyl ester carboxylesterase